MNTRLASSQRQTVNPRSVHACPLLITRPSVLDLIPQADQNPSSTHLRSKPDVTFSGDVTRGRRMRMRVRNRARSNAAVLAAEISRRVLRLASDKYALYTSSVHGTGVTAKVTRVRSEHLTMDQSNTFVA